MYRLNCPPPCAEMQEFRKDGMRPHRVADEVFRRGYASEGEYELVDERTTPRERKKAGDKPDHRATDK